MCRTDGGLVPNPDTQCTRSIAIAHRSAYVFWRHGVRYGERHIYDSSDNRPRGNKRLGDADKCCPAGQSVGVHRLQVSSKRAKVLPSGQNRHEPSANHNRAYQNGPDPSRRLHNGKPLKRSGP